VRHSFDGSVGLAECHRDGRGLLQQPVQFW
jgi:hypothetical protein